MATAFYLFTTCRSAVRKKIDFFAVFVQSFVTRIITNVACVRRRNRRKKLRFGNNNTANNPLLKFAQKPLKSSAFCAIFCQEPIPLRSQTSTERRCRHFDAFSKSLLQITANLETTIRQGGVIGLWASPIANRRALKAQGPQAMRHTGLGKLGGLINTAVHATKRSPGKSKLPLSPLGAKRKGPLNFIYLLTMCIASKLLMCDVIAGQHN